MHQRLFENLDWTSLTRPGTNCDGSGSDYTTMMPSEIIVIVIAEQRRTASRAPLTAAFPIRLHVAIEKMSMQG